MARLDPDLTQWNYVIKRMDIISEVRKVFWEVLVAQEKVKMMEELTRLSQKGLDTVLERIKVGRVYRCYK